jgi:hypothetical protein
MDGAVEAQSALDAEYHASRRRVHGDPSENVFASPFQGILRNLLALSHETGEQSQWQESGCEPLIAIPPEGPGTPARSPPSPMPPLPGSPGHGLPRRRHAHRGSRQGVWVRLKPRIPHREGNWVDILCRVYLATRACLRGDCGRGPYVTPLPCAWRGPWIPEAALSWRPSRATGSDARGT